MFDGSTLATLADSDGEVLLDDANHIIEMQTPRQIVMGGDVYGYGTDTLLISTGNESQAYLFSACE